MTLTMDFATLLDGHRDAEIAQLCDGMDAAYQAADHRAALVGGSRKGSRQQEQLSQLPSGSAQNQIFQ